jgi:hypothetical protein
LASGGLGASPASPPLEAYAVFGPGYKEGRFVWLSRKPFGTGQESEYAKVDITKLANEDLRFTNDGHLLHRGDIPPKAITHLNPITPAVIAYTGSDEPFTRFDVSKLGKRTDPGFFGRGAYTTTDFDKAGRWGTHVMAVEIPSDARFLKVDGIDDLYSKHGMRPLTLEEGNLPQKDMRPIYAKIINDWTDEMIKQGYEGVEWARRDKDTQYVLFHPEDYVFTLVKD